MNLGGVSEALIADSLPGMHYLHAEAPVKVIHRDLKSRNGSLLQPRWFAVKFPFFLNFLFIYFCPAVVMTADKVLKVGVLILTHEKSPFQHRRDGPLTFLIVVPVGISDLWLRCVQVPLSHHSHDGGGNLPLDGPRSHPESARLRDLRHLLLRRGELWSHTIIPPVAPSWNFRCWA